MRRKLSRQNKVAKAINYLFEKDGRASCSWAGGSEPRQQQLNSGLLHKVEPLQRGLGGYHLRWQAGLVEQLSKARARVSLH